MFRSLVIPAHVVVDYSTKYQVGGLIVWWDSELQGIDEKSFFNGFNIQNEADPRWTFDDPQADFYLASIHQDDSVLVGVPAVKYDHLYHIDGFVGTSECVRKDIDEERNKIVPVLKKFKKLPMHWYLLQFPPRPGMTGVRLSVKEIYKCDDIHDDTSLELRYFPNLSKHHVVETHATWWATWNVVCNDIGEKERDRKRGSPELEEKKSKAAMQAELFVRHMYSRTPPLSSHGAGGTYSEPFPDSSASIGGSMDDV
jgi:hypothetical protein